MKKIILLSIVLVFLIPSLVMALYCDKCGTENKESAKFCYRCGKELGAGTKPGILCVYEGVKVDDFKVTDMTDYVEFRYITSPSGRLVFKLPSGTHVLERYETVEKNGIKTEEKVEEKIILKPGQVRSWPYVDLEDYYERVFFLVLDENYGQIVIEADEYFNLEYAIVNGKKQARGKTKRFGEYHIVFLVPPGKYNVAIRLDLREGKGPETQYYNNVEVKPRQPLYLHWNRKPILEKRGSHGRLHTVGYETTHRQEYWNGLRWMDADAYAIINSK